MSLLGMMKIENKTIENMEIIVTVEMAVAKTIAGLRAIPEDWTNIGHESASTSVRNAAARRMVDKARLLASELEAMPPTVAAQKLGDYKIANFLANLDPHGFLLGKWPQVAFGVCCERPARYTLTDGVLGEYFTEAAFQEALAAGRIQYPQHDHRPTAK